jgi:hypothetical protein
MVSRHAERWEDFCVSVCSGVAWLYGCAKLSGCMEVAKGLLMFSENRGIGCPGRRGMAFIPIS